MTRSGPLRAAAAALLLAGWLNGCGSPSEPDLTVFAASSLKSAFTAIGEQYQTENPGTRIEFVFAGSADLLTQLTGGARADVLATADTATMDKAGDAGLLAGEPVDFAANTLTIAVAPGNPKNVGSFGDLARPDLAVVVCAPQVPCGAATRSIENATGVRLTPVSEESNVSDVLAKVVNGQADAGVVYATDARSAGRAVTAVPVPQAAGAPNTYPIAVLEQSTDLELAERFADLVTGEAGQRILAATGFGKP